MKFPKLVLSLMLLTTLLGFSTISQAATTTSHAQTGFVANNTVTAPTTTKPQVPNQIANQHVDQSNQSQQSVLPQTSERSSWDFSILGMISLVSLASFHLRTKLKTV